MAQKTKTPKNSRKPTAKAPLLNLEPTSSLSAEARQEFDRLVWVLDNRGMLERCEVGHITQAARLKARLDKAFADDDMKVFKQLTSEFRGVLRELGLTLHPSRSHVHTTAKDPAAADDKWRGKLKVHGF